MNKKADAGTKITGEQVVSLITAVLVSLALIYLIIVMFNFFTEKNNIRRAESELKEMRIAFESVVGQQTTKEYFVLHAPQWYLFSTEYADLCSGPFCLCLCKEKDCGSAKKRACVATDKFVSIKENGRETRLTFLKEPPSKLLLKFSNEKVYPANGAAQTVQSSYLLWAGAVLPLFFKFDEQWLWSPDLEAWMDTSSTRITAGKWANTPYSEIKESRVIIEALKEVKNSRADGEEVLRRFKASKSEGVYIIENE